MKAQAKRGALVAANKPRLMLPPEAIRSLEEPSALDARPPIVPIVGEALILAEGWQCAGDTAIARGLFGAASSFSRAPLSLLSELADTSRKRFVRVWQHLACLACCISRHLRHTIVALAHRHRSEVMLLQSVDVVMFDETPMVTRLTDDRLVARGVAPGGRPAHITGKAPRVADTAPTKLLQTRNSWAYLLRAARDGQDSFVGVFGRVPNHVQPLSSTSGLCLASALLDTSSASMGESAFLHRCRLAVTDGAASNFVAERLLQSIRSQSDSWSHLHLRCHAHLVALCHDFAVAPLERCVSGLVNTSVSMSHAGVSRAFRDALRDVLKSRLRVRIGESTTEAALYRIITF